MPARQKTKHQLRCFCRRRPLLAMYGIDEHGKLYIHMRIFKAQRIFGEMMVTDGTVLIHCRECLRWHKVKIVQPDTATLEETEPPVQVAN